MANIVIDARELRTSSGRYVEKLLHYLQDVDKINQYKILLKPEDFDGWQPKSSSFQKISCNVKEFSFAEQLALNKQLKGLRPDLVHFTFAQQPIRYRGTTVTTIHDLTTLRFNNPAKNMLVFKLKQKVYGFVIKKAVRKASKVIVPSQFVKDDLVSFSGINKNKVIVTYESADVITEPSEPLTSLVGKPFIMYVGRPTPHKNLKCLVEAFALVKQSRPDLKLVLAGKKDSNYRRIESFVARSGYKDVVFTDFISEGQLRWLYEHCQTYVYPSLSEGFGLPGLEAMVHGAPVVSSNATCLPEVYGKAAYYFDPLDVKAMAKAINEVLEDDKLRQKLIETGKIQASKYSWQRMARQTLDIYNQVLQ